MVENTKIPVFISYSNIDQAEAEIVKNHLTSFDTFDVFIAPDNVTIGSQDYLSEIYRKIKNCKVFLTFISKTSYKTYFADHECGIAIALEKIILPICIDDTPPYGFLRKYHGVFCKEVCIDSKLNEIENFILTTTYRDKEYVELIVSALCNAMSFEDAGHWAKKLRDCPIIPENQMELIKTALSKNSQIYYSFVAKPIVVKIISTYEKQIMSCLMCKLGFLQGNGVHFVCKNPDCLTELPLDYNPKSDHSIHGV